jgi:hypothetical protein
MFTLKFYGNNLSLLNCDERGHVSIGKANNIPINGSLIRRSSIYALTTANSLTNLFNSSFDCISSPTSEYVINKMVIG